MSEANYFNKIITNHAVDLTDDEIAVLSVTLGRIMSGGYTDYKYWRPTIGDDGNCTWKLDRNIIDPPNPAKVVGDDGRTPVFSADPTNAHLVWAYEDAVETSGWSDIPYALSGQVGPRGNKGEPGKDGVDGRDPIFQVNDTSKELEWKYSDATSGWSPLGLTTSGQDGFSPTVVSTDAPTSQEHPQGGTKLTFTFGPAGTQTQDVYIWNGINGQGAQFAVLEGTGIHVVDNGTNFTISLSASYVDEMQKIPVLAAASADWNKVSQKFDTSAWDAASGRFVTSAGLQDDTWYLFTTSGWKPSDSVLTTIVTDSTLSGTGWDSSPLGLAQNVREITFSAGYADNAKYAEKVTDGTYEYDLFPLINTFALNNSSYLTTIQHDSTLSGTGHTASQLGIAGNVNIPSFSAGYAAKANSAASAYHAQYFTYGNRMVPIAAYAEMIELAIDSLHATEPGYREDELDEPPLIAEYAASAYLGQNSASGFNAIVDELHGKLDTSAANYLPLSGGTVYGETVISGAQNSFDSNFLKFVRDGNNGSARIGLASSEGMIAIKASKQNGNDTVQVNIQHASNTNEMIQVQKSGNAVGYLIPADIRNSESGLTDDGVLHIILDS